MLDREGDPDNDFTPIVLVECDGCTFVRKSKNVQDIGGALMLIMTHTARQNPEDMVMIDDGTGTSITIPTMQINRADGEKLKKAIAETEKNNEDSRNRKEYVVLLVDFEMENPDDKCKVGVLFLLLLIPCEKLLQPCLNFFSVFFKIILTRSKIIKSW